MILMPPIPPESPLSLQPTFFELLSQDLSTFFKFLIFLLSHPSILHSCYILLIVTYCNVQGYSRPSPRFISAIEIGNLSIPENLVDDVRVHPNGTRPYTPYVSRC